jgi:hypothetical protein
MACKIRAAGDAGPVLYLRGASDFYRRIILSEPVSAFRDDAPGAPLRNST